jgi:glycolate oxidase FAD binding subunit
MGASGGARLVWRLEGGALEVAARAARASGTRVDDAEWEAAEAALCPDPAHDELRVRLAARPSDTRALVRALAARAAPDSRLVALPITGTVLADLPESALPELYAEARRERWLLALERAAPEVRVRHDAFGPAPDALPLMRVLKQRFDPGGVLSPGRFVGRI